MKYFQHIMTLSDVKPKLCFYLFNVKNDLMKLKGDISNFIPKAYTLR